MAEEKSLQGVELEEKVVKCPDCGSSNISYKDGERFCKKCGFVFE